MEGVILDLNMQIKPSAKVVGKESNANESNFSSTLKSIEEKNKSLEKKANEDKNNISNSTKTTKDKSKSDEEPNVHRKNNINKNEEENIIAMYGNIFRLEDSTLTADESKDSIESEIDITINESSFIFEKDLINIVSEEDIEMVTVESQNVLEEENIEISNIPMDNQEVENSHEGINDLQLGSKTQDLNMKFQHIKEEPTSQFNDIDSKLANNYISNTEETDDSEFQEFPLDKVDNTQSEFAIDKDSNVISKDAKMEIDDHPLLSVERNEFRFVKDNPIELDRRDSVDKKDLIQQIVQKVKFDPLNPKNEIKIKLKPEFLGEMTMNIEVVKGTITAKIMVDNQRTKEIIQSNLVQLKEEIKDTGLEIKTFEVFVGNDSDFNKHNFNGFSFNRNNKRIKIKNSNTKVALNYDEQSSNANSNTIDLYSKGALNLLA